MVRTAAERYPLCFCQQSIKYVNEAKGYIDDYFVFTCGSGKPDKTSYISPQRENVTNGGTGERHKNGVYDMYVRQSSFKFIMNYEWNSEAIGFKDDGGDQYKWVIEYQCGTRPDLPVDLCFNNPVDGKCFFTGVQMYVRDLDYMEEGRKEMIAYMHSLGEKSNSAPVAWVMDDFTGGTFPPWFVNTDYRDSCPFPCKEGVYNEETGMWGCPTQKAGVELTAPLQF